MEDHSLKLIPAVAAKMLGKSPKTLEHYRLDKNHDLPFIRLPNGHVRYELSAVQEYLAKIKAKRLAVKQVKAKAEAELRARAKARMAEATKAKERAEARAKERAEAKAKAHAAAMEKLENMVPRAQAIELFGAPEAIFQYMRFPYNKIGGKAFYDRAMIEEARDRLKAKGKL